MKIKQAIPLSVVVFFILFRYFALWCTNAGEFCYGSWLDNVYFYLIEPPDLFSLVTLPLAVVLCFVSASIFKSWFKFAVWWIPLSVLVITLAPESSGSLFSLYSFEKIDAAWMMSSFFVMVSVGIIVGKLLPMLFDKYFAHSHAIVRVWLKFIYFWLPFSLAFLVMPPLVDEFLDGYFFNFLGFYINLEYRAWFAGGLFVLISLGIIVWKTIALRKKN